MELGSHSELDNPLLRVSTAGCPDSVTLFQVPTAGLSGLCLCRFVLGSNSLVVRTLSLCSRFRQQLVVWTLSLSLCQLLKEQVAEYTLKSLGTGEVPTTLAYISALVVVHGLFGLRGSERFGRAIHRYPPFPCPQ